MKLWNVETIIAIGAHTKYNKLDSKSQDVPPFVHYVINIS